MKIILKTRNIKIDSEMEQYVQVKIGSLERLGKILHEENHIKINEKPRVEALIELGRENMHHKKGEIFFAGGMIKFPGRTIKASAKSENLKLAINELYEELGIEIKKNKEKLISLNKKRSRNEKKKFHLSSQAVISGDGKERDKGIL